MCAEIFFYEKKPTVIYSFSHPSAEKLLLLFGFTQYIISSRRRETMAGHLIERIIREGQCSASCDIKAGRQGVPGHCPLDTSTASTVVQPLPR